MFECALDGNGLGACSTPLTTAPLSDGVHTFEVRAADVATNVDATPALASWTVDTVPPETAIVSAPPSETRERRADFEFSSEPGATFLCSLDEAVEAPCTSPLTTPELDRGTHHFSVVAVDEAGNRDATAAQHEWVIEAAGGGSGGCGCTLGGRTSPRTAVALVVLAAAGMLLRRRSGSPR